ncbi:TMEM175 family protein [Streptomyces chiangmaiensis]
MRRAPQIARPLALALDEAPAPAVYAQLAADARALTQQRGPEQLSAHDALFGLLRRDLVVGPERLAMLGDAVFAIAITLLAFEITVPEGLPESHVAHAVRDAMPTVGAYLFSFAVIGALWPPSTPCSI